MTTGHSIIQPVKILVVENDPEIAQSTLRLLRKAGFATVVACSGKEALNVAQTHRPHIILLDRDLPDSAGLEVGRQIKMDPNLTEAFIILISDAQVHSDEPDPGSESMMDDYLVRPLTNQELLARIQVFVRLLNRIHSLNSKAQEVQKTNQERVQARKTSLNHLQAADPGKRRKESVVPELNESEWILKTFFATPGILQGIVEVLDDDILHLADNVASAAFFGQTVDAIRGKRASELGVPKEIIRLWIHHYEQSRLSNQPAQFEYEHQDTKNRRYIFVSVSCLGEESSGHTRYVYTAHDVTRHKMDEKALNQRRIQQVAVAEICQIAFNSDLKTFLSKATQIVAETLDIEDCDILQIKSEFEHSQFTSGMERKGLLGDRNSPSGEQSQADNPGFLSQTPSLTENEALSHAGVLIQTSDGAWGILRAHSRKKRRFSDQDLDFLSTVAGFLGNTIERDAALTSLIESEFELSKREREQRQLNEKLAIAQEIGRLGHWETDLNTMKVQWSDQIHHMFETDPNSFQPTHQAFLERVHPEDREKVNRAFHESIETGSESSVEHRICTASAEEKTVEERWRIELDQDGNKTKAVGTCQDITERKRNELRLRCYSTLTAELSQSETFREASEAVVKAADLAIGWDRCVVALTNPGENHLKSILSMDLVNGRRSDCTDEPGDPRVAPFANRVLKEGAFLENRSVDDLESDALAPIAFGDARRLSASLMYAPITAGTDHFGFVSIQSHHIQAYDEGDLEQLKELVNLSAGTFRRIRASKALQDSEALYHSLVENLPQNIYRKDLTGRFVFVSDNFCRFVGLSKTQILGATDFDIVSPELAASYRQDDLKVIESRKEFEKIESHRTRDGRDLIVEIHKTPIRDSEGKVIGTQGIFWDITAQQRAAEMMRIAARAIEACPLGIVICDARKPDIPILSVNSAFSRITGYSAEEAVARNCRFLQGKDTNQPGSLVLRKAILSGESAKVTLRNYRKDGTRFDNQIRIAPVLDERGRLSHFIGIQEDITERLRLEEQTKHIQISILEAQESERRRIARELHDSSAQDLVSVMMNLEMLITESTASGADMANILQDCQALLEKVAHEIRTLSYILHPPRLDEDGLPGAIQHYVEGLRARTGLSIDLLLESELKQFNHAVQITLFRVMQESLGNIQRHAPGAKATIRLSSDHQNLVKLEIIDTGPGMDPAIASGAKHAGVGISGMRERMSQVGGLLTIESDQHGTAVRASIPLKPLKGT